MNGKSHALISTTIGITGAVVEMATAPSFYAVMDGVSFFLGAMAGIVLSPDLDINHQTYSEKVMGPFRYPFYLYWLPYALILPHRSFWSHCPIIGTLVRLVYGFWWIPVLNMFKVWDIVMTNPNFPNFAFWVILGLIMSDTGHWIADKA